MSLKTPSSESARRMIAATSSDWSTGSLIIVRYPGRQDVATTCPLAVDGRNGSARHGSPFVAAPHQPRVARQAADWPVHIERGPAARAALPATRPACARHVADQPRQ